MRVCDESASEGRANVV